MKKIICSMFVLIMVLGGCGAQRSTEISIAGSSTVYPITLEAQDKYLNEVNPNAVITLEENGTGGGFELFTKGQTAINDASRAINDDEIATAQENGISYSEYKIGVDGITIIINPENDWAAQMTTEELKTAFEAGSDVTKWSDINPNYPDEEINFYGPTSASGTYDFFVEKIIGDEKSALRDDMNATENDNEIITNIQNDKNGIGFLGYSYYSSNKDTVQSVALDSIDPTLDTIKSGEYGLSRPLYIYVNNQMMEENEELKNFVTYYIENSQELVSSAGYVALSDEEQAELDSTIQ